MSARLAELPAGDATKGWWNYHDLAVVFGLSVHRIKTRMSQWEAKGFPAPLPYSLREKRWRPAAVLAWRDRLERSIGAAAPAAPPKFRMIAGGKD